MYNFPTFCTGYIKTISTDNHTNALVMQDILFINKHISQESVYQKHLKN